MFLLRRIVNRNRVNQLAEIATTGLRSMPPAGYLYLYLSLPGLAMYFDCRFSYRFTMI